MSSIVNELAEQSPSFEQVLESFVIVTICVIVVAGNVLIIAALSISPSPREVMDYYILSVSGADLAAGITIIPLSVYPALVQNWVYGDFLCRFTGYLSITLWSVSVYTFMWIGVDRYMAIRKPLRYETLQTRTRCQCWILFTWLTSIFLCCPPLLGFSRGAFYKDGYVCMLDLGSTLPYSLTLAGLVLLPSVMTTLYTYTYIFATMRRLRQCLSKDHSTATEEHLSNPDHGMAFVVILLFWVAWLPWLCLHLYEIFSGTETDIHALHFWFLWMGVSCCGWKVVVYATMSPKFRDSVKHLGLTLCCRAKSRHHHHTII